MAHALTPNYCPWSQLSYSILIRYSTLYSLTFSLNNLPKQSHCATPQLEPLISCQMPFNQDPVCLSLPTLILNQCPLTHFPMPSVSTIFFFIFAYHSLACVLLPVCNAILFSTQPKYLFSVWKETKCKLYIDLLDEDCVSYWDKCVKISLDCGLFIFHIVLSIYNWHSLHI